MAATHVCRGGGRPPVRHLPHSTCRQVVLLCLCLPLLLAASPASAQVLRGWWPGNGDFEDPLKWAPWGMPQPADTAAFLLPGVSLVTFGSDHATHALWPRHGYVRFLLDGHTYTVTNPSSVYPFAINVGFMENVLATLELHNGTLSGQHAVIGALADSGGTVVVNTGATWTNTGTLYLGYGGYGVLNVQNGGVLTSQHGCIGVVPGGWGQATVTGAGSAWETGDLWVGGWAAAAGGVGSLEVGHGGRVSASGTLKIWRGTVTLDGGTITTRVLDLRSLPGTFYWNAGTLRFTNNLVFGMDSPFAYQFFVKAGRNLEVAGTLTIGPGELVQVYLNGGAITTTSFQNTAGGTFHHHDGTLTVRGGTYAPGTTDLKVNGNTPTAWPHLVLDGATSSERFNFLNVGYDAQGALTITGGGWVSSVSGVVGSRAGSTGAVTVDGWGSTWTTDSLYVGSAGAGTLAVTGGGGVSSSYVVVGGWAGSTGAVTVDGSGSTWTTDSLCVGSSGSGTLAVTGGGQVWTGEQFMGAHGYVGWGAGSTGEVTVDGSGSTWTHTTNLYVGGSDSAAGGTGMLTVRNEGLVSVGGTLKVWPTGTLTVDGGTVTAGGLAGSAGAVVALRDPAGGTALTVGSAASDTFSGTLIDNTGPGSLTKIGTGTQVLGGAGIAYTGTTTVLEGILRLSDTTAFASDILNSATAEFEVTAGTWTFDEPLGGAGTFVKSGAGTLVISGPQDYDAVAIFEILAGTVDMNTDASGTGLIDDADLSILVTGAVLNFGCNQHLDTLTLLDGALVRFTGANVVVLKHLVMDGIDLGAMTLTPEPATLALLALGGLLLLCRRRKC